MRSRDSFDAQAANGWFWTSERFRSKSGVGDTKDDVKLFFFFYLQPAAYSPESAKRASAREAA
jgi:hypothetical protein